MTIAVPDDFGCMTPGTSQIDQVISLNALQAMKPDGRAVLILGGKLGRDTDQRSERYNSRESRAFYHLLYQHYRVTQHYRSTAISTVNKVQAFPSM